MGTRKTGREPPQLRADAETRLARTPPAEELLHELQVYQIELEMQNEELKQAHLALEESRDRYLDLYEFAPIGYFTLTREGMISEANLTGAALLGVERKKLLHRRFAHFVTPKDHDRWHQHFMSVVHHGAKQCCELVLKRDDDSIFHARLDSLLGREANDDSPLVCIALADISEQKRSTDRLRASEDRYRQILQTSIDGFWIVSSDGRFLDVNTAYCQMIGYEREELLNMRIPDVEAMETPQETALHIQELMAKGYCRFETRHRRKDGLILEIEVSTVYQPGAEGGYVCAFLRDITESKRAEEDLRIAAITFESQEGMMVTDANGIIVRVNQAFTRLTGYSTEEAVGKTPSLLKSGRHDQAFYQGMWAALKEKQYWQGETWNRRKNGKIYAEWLTITAVTAPDGHITHYVGTFSDITQNREAEAEIHRLAYYDPLTQLPNRRLLQDRLGQALAASRRSGYYGAILFLDLDNFKTLNDTRGHEVGDLLLVEVAQRLHTCVRGGDTVGRLGGDEFVILLEDLSEEAEAAAAQSKLVGEKVQEVIARPYLLKDCEYHCTTSIGISLFRDHNLTVEDLLMHADLAMYQAKDAGRNTLRFFDPAMQAALDARSALETDLRLAMKHQQLLLYYQPQMESTRGVTGAEVLLRWVHPERGLVLPGDFISLAEETGLILPIGHWVLEMACAQLKAWENNLHTRDLQLAINVSAHQFRQQDFVAQVQQVLLETGADPTRLKIELTESLVLDSVSDTITKMQALKAIGVGFSMDDFGTGYSSLSYLKRLPLDKLKIDRSFVNDLATNINDAAIVLAIITMGRTFGLNVIAEGVETEAQRDFLDRNGCHAFQGYLFSRPVPLAEFEQFLNLNQA